MAQADVPEHIQGKRCADCGRGFVYAPVACSICGGTRWESVRFSDAGTVYSYARVAVPPAHLRDRAPYMVALVQVDDQVRLLARVEGEVEGIEIGTRVRIRQEDGVYLVRASP